MELFRAVAAALGGALQRVFIVGVIFAALALVVGFMLPKQAATAAAPPTEAPSTADCERMLMAEMATMEAEHEPAMTSATSDE